MKLSNNVIVVVYNSTILAFKVVVYQFHKSRWSS